MAVSAYILIQTEIGRAAEVARQIRGFTGVMAADDVTGAYDVIVRTEVETMNDLGKHVVGPLQLLEGITKTLTCVVVDLE